MPTIVPGSCHLNEGCGWRDGAMPRNKGTNITTAGVAAPRSQLGLGAGAFKRFPWLSCAGDTGQGQWTGIPG